MPGRARRERSPRARGRARHGIGGINEVRGPYLVPGAISQRGGDGGEGLGPGDEQEVQPRDGLASLGEIIEKLPAPRPPLPGVRVGGDVLELVDRREDDAVVSAHLLPDEFGHRQARQPGGHRVRGPRAQHGIGVGVVLGERGERERHAVREHGDGQQHARPCFLHHRVHAGVQQ